MRKHKASLLVFAPIAGALLLSVSLGAGHGGGRGGGGGRDGGGGHISAFSSGGRGDGGYPGGFIGGSGGNVHIGGARPSIGFPSGDFRGAHVMGRPGDYSLSRPGAWPSQGFRTLPGREGNINRWNGWGHRYVVRYPFYSSWYHGNWYDHGNRWWYYGPTDWWWGGGLYDWGLGGYASPWRWGYYSYYNPYYDAGDGAAVYNYSQPLILAAQPPDAATVDATSGLSAAEQEGIRLLDQAKASFRQGDYDDALKEIDAAVKFAPEDRIFHEFRGLVLFALGHYRESAAAVYAVLSAGPGWDWTTLSGLYANVDTYTKQLRALERYAADHSDAGDAFFLLGYHYLVCGHPEAAAAQFAQAAKANPKDRLSSQLAAALKHGDQNAPVVAESGPAEPVDVASLTGGWTAKRTDGASIALTLTPDKRFTWKLEDREKPRAFSGVYALSDNLLIFKQNDKPVMVGQVKPLDGGGFNFRIVGDNPSDPGLNFVK